MSHPNRPSHLLSAALVAPLALVAGCDDSSATPTPSSARQGADQAVRIMPLGDSLTQGDEGNPSGHRSYRGALYQALTGAGYAVDFVGTQNDAPASGGDPHHEGHGGYTIGPDAHRFCDSCETANVADHIESWLAAADPDIVLVQLGINDMFRDGVDPGDAPGKLEALVEQITTAKPDATVLLASLLPVRWTDGWSDYDAVNAAARAIGDASATDRVRFVDMNTQMEAVIDRDADYADDVHLSASGAAKVADVWFEAITTELDGEDEGGGACPPEGEDMCGGFDLEAHLLSSAEGTPSEATPHGVPPGWSWVAGATAVTVDTSDNYTHANFWGAIFRGMSNAHPANTKVEVRDCSLWLLYEGADSWTSINEPALAGSSFTPTYNGSNVEPDIEFEGTGALVRPADELIWHYWPSESYQPVQFNNIQDVMTNCSVRLVLDDPAGPDDRDEADYLVHMGADWRDPNDPPCANDNYICPSFGVGKFVRVTSEWRNASFHSLTAADIDGGVPLPPASAFMGGDEEDCSCEEPPEPGGSGDDGDEPSGDTGDDEEPGDDGGDPPSGDESRPGDDDPEDPGASSGSLPGADEMGGASGGGCSMRGEGGPVGSAWWLAAFGLMLRSRRSRRSRHS